MPPWADVRNCGVNQPWVKAIIYLSFTLLIAGSITSPHKWLQEASGSFEEGPLQSSVAKRRTSSSHRGVWCSALLGEESPGLHLERGSAFIICQFHQMSSTTYLCVLVMDPVSYADRLADGGKWADLVSVDFEADMPHACPRSSFSQSRSEWRVFPLPARSWGAPQAPWEEQVSPGTHRSKVQEISSLPTFNKFVLPAELKRVQAFFSLISELVKKQSETSLGLL